MAAKGPEEFTVRNGAVQVFDRQEGTDDASDMYVLYVDGVSVLIRTRLNDAKDLQSGTHVYVHIENEDGAPRELKVEVNNGGEDDYQI